MSKIFHVPPRYLPDINLSENKEKSKLRILSKDNAKLCNDMKFKYAGTCGKFVRRIEYIQTREMKVFIKGIL